MDWYQSKSIDGEAVEGVSAECPRCGFRVFAEGTRKSDIVRCTQLLSENCPRDEANRYTFRVLRNARTIEEVDHAAFSGQAGGSGPSHPD